MAFTNYKTWSVGETLTAANFNQQIRDNGLTMGEHLIARKTADQTVTSSTTLVDCTSLVLPVAANDVWQFTFNVAYTASTAGDIKIGFTIPTSSRLDASLMWVGSTGTTVNFDWWGTSSPTSFNPLIGGGVAAARYIVPIRGIYVGGANAGNVTLQFAQNTSDGTPSTIYTNSTVWGVKLA